MPTDLDEYYSPDYYSFSDQTLKEQPLIRSFLKKQRTKYYLSYIARILLVIIMKNF